MTHAGRTKHGTGATNSSNEPGSATGSERGAESLDLDGLRAVAEAATPGPWTWEPPSDAAWPQGDESLVAGDDRDPVLSGWGYDACGTEASDEDRAHIATFDPPTVLTLLARLEAAEKERDSLRFELDGARSVARGDNAYLIARAEAAEAKASRFAQALANGAKESNEALSKLAQRAAAAEAALDRVRELLTVDAGDPWFHRDDLRTALDVPAGADEEGQG